MKGVELPINILVVVAVAVIVLLGLVALYFSGFIGPAGTVNAASIKEKYCARIMNNPSGCQGSITLNTIAISDYDADKDGTVGTADTGTGWTWATSTCANTANPGASGDNLASFLECYYSVKNERDGLKSCGCAI